MEKLCGIDEAGRGPCAGPLVVAGVILNSTIDGLNDSKKLTQKKREKLYNTIIENSDFYIVTHLAKEIDEFGLSKCMKNSLETIMKELNTSNFLFDGNTSFGVCNLKTQVKADVDVPQVSAASILAKVTRDRYMVEISKEYPEYGFEKHKGYGTAYHIEQIKKYGFTPLHRKTYKIKALKDILI